MSNLLDTLEAAMTNIQEHLASNGDVDKLIIDEDYLSDLSKVCRKIANDILELCYENLNQERDNYDRFMTFVQLFTFYKNVEQTHAITRQTIALGHAFAHPMFHTEQAKKDGWADNFRLYNVPFFAFSDNDDDSDDHSEE